MAEAPLMASALPGEQKIEHTDIRQLYLEALQLANGHGAKVVEGREIEPPETEW
jgi:hypothetical protein